MTHLLGSKIKLCNETSFTWRNEQFVYDIIALNETTPIEETIPGEMKFLNLFDINAAKLLYVEGDTTVCNTSFKYAFQNFQFRFSLNPMKAFMNNVSDNVMIPSKP